MSIRLFKASNFNYTPFEDFYAGDLEELNANGIIIVETPSEADIIISQNIKHLKKYLWRYFFGKKIMIWTLEPRFNTDFISPSRTFFGFVKYHVMNIYTKDVFVTNTSIHGFLINKKLKMLSNDFQIENRKIVALMSFYKGLDSPSLIRNGENIDLIALRSSIALEGSSRGVLDVYGKGWPEGVSKEDSRDGDWVSRKKKLMEKYRFNLCFENTATFNYMTEKIWDSIENYCLPIYYGKHTNVYSLFPQNSFIDYSKFNTPDKLFDFIKKLSNKEYVERMNKCIEVYNSISKKGGAFAFSERKKMLNAIVSKVNTMIK